MLKIFKDNFLFFIPFFIFIIIGFILLFTIEQGDAILFFSENRSAFGDFFFKYGTKLGEDYAYAFFFILFLFIRYRYSILVIMTGCVVSIISYVLKEFFRHPRPRTFFSENGMLKEINAVDGVAMLGAYTSFPSGHTMSAFALYGVIAFIIPKKHIGLLTISIAMVIGISRIYLVQHFVKDVVSGAILGVLIGMTLYYINSLVKKDTNQWFDRSIAKRYKKKVA